MPTVFIYLYLLVSLALHYLGSELSPSYSIMQFEMQECNAHSELDQENFKRATGTRNKGQI
jgi:hypothetical protein